MLRLGDLRFEDQRISVPSAPRFLLIAHQDAGKHFGSQLVSELFVFLRDRAILDGGSKRI